MVEMNLMVRSDEFFAQFVRLAAEERHLQPGECGPVPRQISIRARKCSISLYL